MKNLILLLFALFSIKNYSQQEENNTKGAIRIISENDFWLFKNKTDIYYTQGIKIEYLHNLADDSKFSKWWPFLLKNKTENIRSFSLGQNLYTSTDITIPAVMEDDRPYSAWLYISNSTISNNKDTNKRLTTDLYLGVIGPAALGEEVQSTWHELIGSPDPKGWANQIKNDIGINLNIKYEKGVLSTFSKNIAFDFVPNIQLQAGSVFNITSIGTTTRLSIFNTVPYFKNVLGEGEIPKFLKEEYSENQQKRKNFLKSFKYSNISLFTTNSANLVIWNSLLQGGLFSQNSPYLIDNNDIKRVYIDIGYGVSYSNPYFTLSYSRAFRTREFDQQERNHQWGKFHLLIKI
ncbi:lipid A deacylase LpxR family protein [Confluentibacter sediminis]|uniref:lipid A deacylase LpxR family protein n=1 Tax=Confluentibacter sediminis TaxID=2219045 RepID=UPI000DADCD00|nr:lipid A deacylase LpxR family protein [Confluentibacter sediminis]